MSLIKKIKDYYKKGGRILFTTPSHNQGHFLRTPAEKLLGKQFLKYDLSELDGFDNLRNPQGSIKKLLKNISSIYDSKASFILTNGSTSGVIASMLAFLKEGDKVLIARNCHISVYNGLVLCGAVPVWFLPEYDNEWGIYKGIKADQIEKMLSEQDVKALIITSPTYEGLFSELEKIAHICKKHGVIFIVDEAHGALYNFGKFKTKPAIQCGADISVQSLHKTAGAPNPCALVHISNQSSLNPDKLQKALNIINTTSPSYALLASCEAVINYLNSSKGQLYIEKLLSDIEIFKKNISPKISIYSGENDPTKILIKFNDTAPSAIADILNNRYKIEEEFSNHKSMLFICGVGTNVRKLNKLCIALNEISENTNKKCFTDAVIRYDLPDMKYTPRQAFFQDKVSIDTKNAINKISAEAITAYPPGIPVLLPGEVISKDILNKIEQSHIEICC